MLIALLTLWLMGGDASTFVQHIASYQARTAEVVADAARAERADAIFEAMVALTEARDETAVEGIAQLSANVAALAENSQAIVQSQLEINAAQSQYLREFVGLRFALKAELTRDEWNALFPTSATDL